MRVRTGSGRSRTSGRRLVCGLMGLGVVGILAAAYVGPPLHVIDGVDRSYRGAFARAEGFEPLVQRISAMRASALVDVQQRLGVAVEDDGRLIVRFADSQDSAWTGARTVTRFVRGRRCQLLTLYPGPFLLGEADLDRTLRHELSHALMRDRMAWRYWQVPSWVREGTAVWAAGQLEEKADTILAACVFSGRKPAALINGLGTQPHTLDDYLEDALFFELLEQTLGPEMLRERLRALMGGVGASRAFGGAGGWPWRALEARARDFSLQFIESRLAGAAHAEYAEAVAAHQAGQFERAAELLEAFMRRHPDSWLVPNAVYLSGEAADALGEREDAKRAFDAIVRQFPGSPHLVRAVRNRRARMTQ